MTRRANGEGSAIAWHEQTGLFRQSLRWTDAATGKRERRYVYGKTRAIVREKMRELQDRVEGGQPARDSSVKLSAWVEQWLATGLEASKRSRSTKDLYAGLLRRHVGGLVDPRAKRPDPVPDYAVELGARTLKALKPSHVDGLLLAMKEAGLKDSTVRSTYYALCALLAARSGRGSSRRTWWRRSTSPRSRTRPRRAT